MRLSEGKNWLIASDFGQAVSAHMGPGLPPGMAFIPTGSWANVPPAAAAPPHFKVVRSTLRLLTPRFWRSKIGFATWGGPRHDPERRLVILLQVPVRPHSRVCSRQHGDANRQRFEWGAAYREMRTTGFGREIRGWREITIFGNPGTMLVPVTGAKSPVCAAGEIEIEGKARGCLGDHHVWRKH